ncbi:MAG: CBS domain-containing protein [Polyangiaceae bacterium]
MTHFSMPAATYMTRPDHSVAPSATIEEVYRLMSDRGISCVPVVEPGDLPTGVLSRTDLLKLGRASRAEGGRPVSLSWPEATAGEKMHRGVVSVPESAAMNDVARLMVKQRIHRVFVVKEGALRGVVSTKEILLALRDKRESSAIGEHMSKHAFTMPVTSTLAQATDRLWNAHVSGLVVVDEDEHPIGVFTQVEALTARDFPRETPLEDVMSYAMLCLHVSTPLHRAAAHAYATRARRVLVTEDHRVVGVLTGLDFARAASTH